MCNVIRALEVDACLNICEVRTGRETNERLFAGYVFQSLEKTRVVEDCCPGYARTADNSSCVPICAQQCLHGTWSVFSFVSLRPSLSKVFSSRFPSRSVGPDKCECEPGYGGATCNIGKHASYMAFP